MTMMMFHGLNGEFKDACWWGSKSSQKFPEFKAKDGDIINVDMKTNKFNTSFASGYSLSSIETFKYLIPAVKSINEEVSKVI